MKAEVLENLDSITVGESPVSRIALLTTLISIDPTCSEKYARLYLHSLYESNRFFEWRDGLYRPFHDRAKLYCPPVEQSLLKVLEEIPYNFPICVVEETILNAFINLQILTPKTIVYAPSSYWEIIGEALSKKGFQPIVLRKKIPEVFSSKRLFISGLNEKTPLDRHGKRLENGTSDPKPLICYPTIEKILIDCLAGDFSLDQAMCDELFRNALKNCSYNASIMERYAKTRNKGRQLEETIRRIGFQKEFYDR